MLGGSASCIIVARPRGSAFARRRDAYLDVGVVPQVLGPEVLQLAQPHLRADRGHAGDRVAVRQEPLRMGGSAGPGVPAARCRTLRRDVRRVAAGTEDAVGQSTADVRTVDVGLCHRRSRHRDADDHAHRLLGRRRAARARTVDRGVGDDEAHEEQQHQRRHVGRHHRDTEPLDRQCEQRQAHEQRQIVQQEEPNGPGAHRARLGAAEDEPLGEHEEPRGRRLGGQGRRDEVVQARTAPSRAA